MDIKVEISPGELIDKKTILEIKLEKISDPAKLDNINTEYRLLQATCEQCLAPSKELHRLTCALKAVNEKLWVIEDDIRDCERRKAFGREFIDLARSVYKNNDIRARLKREINMLLDSKIVEEKSYRKYD